jgi:hypothetical protein
MQFACIIYIYIYIYDAGGKRPMHAGFDIIHAGFDIITQIGIIFMFMVYI